MRWKEKRYKVGDIWYVHHHKFLFFPLKIGTETRWLEVARWRTKWKETWSMNNPFWENDCFIEKGEKLPDELKDTNDHSKQKE